MKIELFVSPSFSFADLNLKKIEELTKKNFNYASKGRHAIGYIINALQPKNNIVLISPYMCDTVFDKLTQMGMCLEYYDIDIEDLNPSPASIEKRIEETGAGTVIAASLYGNPADMEKIEEICKRKNVYLIDDAAQSFGTKLNNRYIGTFGNGGLFAFSPGKVTAGHMGALYWCDKQVEITRTHHYFAHKTTWLDFKYNRLLTYKTGKVKKSFFSKLNSVITRAADIENDDIEEFEKKILGGVIKSQLDGSLQFRDSVFKELKTKYSQIPFFRIIDSVRGESVHNKLVLVFSDSLYCDSFKHLLNERDIAFFPGYDLSSEKFSGFWGCNEVRNCIVELPIEKDIEHMKYIHETLDVWITNNS